MISNIISKRRCLIYFVLFLLALYYFPVLKFREPSVVLRTSVAVREVLRIRHVIDQEIKKIVFCLINEIAFRIAPFAVVFVEITVRLPADVEILVKRHSAALAVKLSGAS